VLDRPKTMGKYLSAKGPIAVLDRLKTMWKYFTTRAQPLEPLGSSARVRLSSQESKKMHINKHGLNIIKRWEGLELETYMCPAGIPTIGYGHTGPEVQLGNIITTEEADRLLREDVKEAERGVENSVQAPLTSNQFSALVSWTFNLGCGNLKESTMLARINDGNMVGGAEALTWYNKARVDGELKELQGLVNRRNDERELFLEEDD
jgi:lysozyme